MAALGIFTLALLAVMGVFVVTLPLMEQNEESATASNLARSLHERLQDQGIPSTYLPDYNAGTPPASDNFPPSPYPSTRVGETDYAVRVQITPDALRPNLKLVNVSVAWAQGSKQIHQACLYRAP